MDVDTIPVPVTEAGIGTLRVPIDPDDPLLAEVAALVASATVIADFEDQYLNELTGAVEQSLKSIRQLVVQRLRARATIVTPIAASGGRNGEFMNPWHDDIGRFAPKGQGRQVAIREWGTDRRVTIEKWAEGTLRGHKHSVTSSNGDVISLYDHNNLLSQSEGGEQAISDLLNGAADAHDLSPGMNAPKIVVKSVDNLIIDMAEMTGQPRDAWQRLNHVSAFVSAHAPGTIFVNPARVHSEPLLPQDDMPAMLVLGPARYKMMHEYGHLRMHAGLDSFETIMGQFGATSEARRAGGMSKYGNTQPIEAHAEAFAEWAARGGTSVERGPKGTILNNTDYVITSYANTFGWGKDLEAVSSLAAAGSPGEMPLIVGDSLEGPFYIFADGTIDETLVASAGQFMNPWHDEIGRFAPKGTGRNIKVLGEFPGDPSQEMMANADFRYQADMDKRFTWLWQRTYQTHRAVKKIARNLMAGNEPFDGVDLNDPGLARYAETPRYAKGPKHEYGEADLRNDLEGAAQWMLDQPVVSHPPLYRGAMTEESKLSAFKVGGDIPLDLVSATPDRFEAAVYSSPFGSPKTYADPVRLMFQFTNAEGVSLRPFVTGNMSDSKEVVMRGRGRITKMERNKHGIWQIWVDASPAEEEALVASITDEAVIQAILDQPFHNYDENGNLVASALVAAGPFDLSDFNVMTPEEWALAFDVEAADIVGDVVVDAATGQALRPGLNVSDQIITDLIDRHIGRLQGLGPLVQASLRDALALAVREMLPLDDVIREIQATGPLGETAARAIARTELTAATNGGMLTGWRRDGFPFKEWKSLHDDRVRHAHLEADGQVVPTEQEFEVGGFRAQYPGDPRLPVHLRINCRCYMDRLGEDGQTLNTRLVDSTRAQLYRLAQELNIPGRSKMRKDDLFQAIDRYRNGFGYTSLEEMNRAQLLIRARTAGIVGRSRMTKPELMIRLRALATGRNRDRWLIDAGHGTREQLVAVRAQLREDLRVLIEGPIPAIIAAGPPPTVEKIEVIRRKVFRRYGGGETGTAMCVGCGARLHWSNSTRWEQMTLIRLNSKLAWSARNAMPVCLACAPKLAKMTSAGIDKTFTIDNSWTAIIDQFENSWATIAAEFANPWHDEAGKFAPKGTGTKYDAASIKAKVKASTEAGVNVDRVGDPQATLEKLDAWADKMGPEFDADEGVGMARAALNDVETGSKALIANHKNGIAGIISYDYDPASKMYMIHHLGSTGIAPGTGTRLATQVMIQAAANGAGVEFEAAQNDTAPDFWSSMGFDVTDPRHVVMSASEVGAWMRDFTG